MGEWVERPTDRALWGDNAKTRVCDGIVEIEDLDLEWMYARLRYFRDIPDGHVVSKDTPQLVMSTSKYDLDSMIDRFREKAKIYFWTGFIGNED